MATATNVAKYILTLSDEDEGDLISNLKLQKLLYYCQGFSLAITGKPLFQAQLKAWVHGPVVPEVWHAYREFGPGSIPCPNDFEPDSLTADEKSVINEVYNVYGQFSAWKLRDMTHSEAPWAETEKNAVITHERLLEYFQTQVNDNGQNKEARS